jgi:hypothetical protein
MTPQVSSVFKTEGDNSAPHPPRKSLDTPLAYASIYPAITTSGQRTGTFILHRIANPGPLEQQGIPLHEAANHAGVTNAWYREDV